MVFVMSISPPFLFCVRIMEFEYYCFGKFYVINFYENMLLKLHLEHTTCISILLGKKQNLLTSWKWKERRISYRNQSTHTHICAIKIKHQFFDSWLTVGHIPREISRHCYFCMGEGCNITGHLICITYKVSPIPTGGLEVPLLLTFSVKSQRIFKLMKSFVIDI